MHRIPWLLPMFLAATLTGCPGDKPTDTGDDTGAGDTDCGNAEDGYNLACADRTFSGENYNLEGMSGVGDLNGDGYDDIAVGRDYVYLFFGPGDDMGALTLPDEAPVRIPLADYFFSTRDAHVGDLNLDGFDDLALFQWDQDTDTHIEVFLGSPEIVDTEVIFFPDIAFTISGLDYAPIPNIKPYGLTYDAPAGLLVGPLYSISGEPGGTLYFFDTPMDPSMPKPAESAVITGRTGEPIDAWYCESGFSGLGDLDGDGAADVVLTVGDPVDEVRVMTGPFTGTTSTDDAPLILLAPKGTEVRATQFVGDMSGDGYTDLAVGVPDASTVYLFEGSNGLSGVAEIATEYSAAWTSLCVDRNIGDCWTGYSLSAAGDMDGDGADDLAIGDPQAYVEDGRVYVVHGPTGGGVHSLEQEAMQYYQGDPSPTIYSTYYNVVGTEISGNFDFNGDGLSDLLIADDEYDSYYGYYGFDYLVFGG